MTAQLSAVQLRPSSEAAAASDPSSTKSGTAVGLAIGVSVAAGMLWVGALILGIGLSAAVTPQPAPTFNAKLAARAAGPMLPLAEATRGHEVFETTCAACHGLDGMGKPGLGKSLVQSDFVLERNDLALAEFIAKGRDITDPRNTTKVAMPPKGGNASLTDADLSAVVVYVRGLQDPRRLPELPPVVIKVAPPSEDEKKAALAAAGGDAELAEILASGTKLFGATCAACHGKDGKGLQGLGKDLTASEFVGKTSDDELLAFVKRGRAPGEPGNTTGVLMPPKGGNPALSDDDILDIITYVRSLHGGAGAGVKQTARADH